MRKQPYRLCQNLLTVLLASTIARPDAANWIVAYAVLALGVGLGMFLKAAGEDTLSHN
ncbi:MULTISPECIES: hypothetical protein [Brucella]|jgi:hypothetical protein|uniref:Uncharacterized protein n=1 Tax=Brucella lupini TaxID=255457 RepID=A0A256GYX4_9HYPH|nr:MULTISPECIES: hypothetical protein [Brucella]OYR32425.1 hypothetical protein CES86_0081 [Brucella lupini]UVV70794.1 hypothetical protein NW321_23240 [Brucella anthropi]